MTRTIIAPGSVAAYVKARGIQASPAVRVGDLVFVSGFPPFGENGEVVPVSIERQTEIVLDHMRTTLEAAGSSLTKVAKCNVYVDDVAHAETVNRVYNRYFPVDPPARIFLCVAAWPGPFNLEIDCVATV
jgi:2-iminobutanoate/2-iminopropanoate deaminase